MDICTRITDKPPEGILQNLPGEILSGKFFFHFFRKKNSILEMQVPEMKTPVGLNLQVYSFQGYFDPEMTLYCNFCEPRDALLFIYFFQSLGKMCSSLKFVFKDSCLV